MMYRDLIELVTEATGSISATGDPVRDYTYSEVFADKLAIGQNEFYQSNAQGLRPDLRFKIRYVDFEGQTKVRYPITTGKLYDILRTFNPDDEFIELVCQGVVLNGDA